MKFLCLLFVNFFCIAVTSVPYQDSQIVETKVIDSKPDKTDEPTKLSGAHIPKVMDTSNDDEQLTNQQIDTALDDSKEFPKESEWNMKDNINIVLSIIEIIAVVVIYLLTQRETKKQIRKQHKDTEKQIKQQHSDIERLIKKMQENTDKRNIKLIQLGEQIQTSTGIIKKSVKQLEQRSVLEHNKPIVYGHYFALISDYKDLCKELEIEHNHFISNPQNSVIHQKSSSIKAHIRDISQTLSSCSIGNPIPDSKPYMDSIDEVVDKPNLNNKRYQIEKVTSAGRDYNSRLNDYIQVIFNN